MLKSITAYGRSTVDTPLGRFTVEVHSVNRRHLEVASQLPRELMRFENDIRQMVAASVGRGKVTVKVGLIQGDKPLVSIKPNLQVIRDIKEASRQIAELLGLEEASTALTLLQNQSQALIYDEENSDIGEFKKALELVVDQALKEHDLMRITEGQTLQEDIAGRLAILSELCKKVTEKGPVIKEHYHRKLKERLIEALPEAEDGLTTERVIREACLFADKVDIEEELTRFRSHLSQFQKILESDKVANGKKLEFLLQELLRETNTMAAKSPDAELSGFAVEMKTEIERVREQIQNVE